jgi:DNA-binding transcriptional MerR regulator
MTITRNAHEHTDTCRGADDMLRLVPGLSYRQLDFWTSQNYIKVNETHPGHGVYRCWDASEVDVLRRAVRLLDFGFRARQAISLARSPASGDVVALLERQPA